MGKIVVEFIHSLTRFNTLAANSRPDVFFLVPDKMRNDQNFYDA
jgi:hypothetical protein